MEVENERNLLQQADRIASLSECFTWLQQCDECIKQLEECSRAKRPRLTVGHRQSLVARIARLEGAKTRLQRRFMPSCSDCASTSDENNVERLVWQDIDTAFENRVLTGVVINLHHIEPRRFLEDAGGVVIERVRDIIERHGCVKVNTAFNGEFVTGDKRANKSINTKNYELFPTSDLDEWYERYIIEPTLALLDEFQERDSGWALSRILNLTVNVNRYNPMRAGCHITLPREIMSKRAVINVKSTDNACFAWSMVAALYPAEGHSERMSSYPHYTTVLTFDDIEFPMTLKNIGKFERLNNVSINVYGIEEQKILPLRLTDNKREKHVNLLYVQDPQDDNIGHFTLIKNLSRLVSSQLNERNGKKYICDRYVYHIIMNTFVFFPTVKSNKIFSLFMQVFASFSFDRQVGCP